MAGTGFDFHGRTIVVTGGASGLGFAFCQDLAARGARIGVADIEGGKAHTAAVTLQLGGATAFGFEVDVRSASSVERLADDAWDAFGQVDGIFNNAGIGAGRPLVESTEAEFDWTFDVNVKGVWNGSRIFAARFLEQDGPTLIVNTGSEHALGVPHLHNGVYTASKHAVLGMTDVLRRELPDRIQVSLFCPGLVATEIWNSARNRPAEYGGAKQAHPARRAVIDRGMAPEDVAGRALDAIQTGAFYVVTHPHNLDMVQDRHAELLSAFAEQTSEVDGAGYDVNDVLADLLGENAPPRP